MSFMNCAIWWILWIWNPATWNVWRFFYWHTKWSYCRNVYNVEIFMLPRPLPTIANMCWVLVSVNCVRYILANICAIPKIFSIQGDTLLFIALVNTEPLSCYCFWTTHYTCDVWKWSADCSCAKFEIFWLVFALKFESPSQWRCFIVANFNKRNALCKTLNPFEMPFEVGLPFLL